MSFEDEVEYFSAYEAGAESRQAEIDALQEKYRIKSEFLDDADAMIKYQDSVIAKLKRELEVLKGMHNAVSLTAGELFDEVKALQKRIDDALNHLETHLFCELPKAIEILKGEQN